MAPIRRPVITKRRPSITLLRRRSLIAPKSFTFAPNVTPISYPSDPSSPSDDSSARPAPAEGTEASDDAAQPQEVLRSRRRNGRKNSLAHIPRPPNAFMLFRQNFVHQRHVPGSIETNHHSLSRIVGNCWKALLASEKKVWEVLAEKKKEEHKRMYPDYRFQPKHDPEKKRKRQAARAAAEKVERERLERVRLEEEARRMNGLGNIQAAAEASSNSGIENNHFLNASRSLLCHRRSSSVPLPSGAHGFGANSYGLALADPFNFANPAVAQAPPSSTNAGRIALPTLPTNLNRLYVPRISVGMSNAPNAVSESPPHLPIQNLDIKVTDAAIPSYPTSQLAPVTLSRVPSPRLLPSMNLHTNSDNGMAFTMNNMHTLGMGARAARQHQLGQLGRRASSTQPILQHQYTSGAFPYLNLFATGSTYPQATVFNTQDQPFADPNGFVGDIAEGFTNPFAQPQDGTSISNSETAGSQLPTAAYSNSIPPNAMWYGGESVDPMSSVVGSTPPPNTDSYCSQHQPQQQQGSHAIQDVSISLADSMPGSTARANFGLAPMSSSALAFNMRDSFDFTAFNEVFSSITQSQSQESVPSAHSRSHLGAYHQTDDVPPHVMPNGSPSHTNDIDGVTLAQPVPMRKVITEDLSDNQSANAQSYYVQRLQQPYASTTTSNSGSSTPADHNDAHQHVQQQSPSYGTNEYATGHELLDAPINVLSAGTSDFTYELALGLDMNLSGVGTSLDPDLHFGMNYSDYASVGATENLTDAHVQSQAQYGVARHDLEQVGQAPEPHYSFGNYVRSSPFAIPAVVH